jgi:hypothetical protein
MFLSVIAAGTMTVLILAGGAPTVFAQDEEPPTPEAQEGAGEDITSRIITAEDGTELEEIIIDGPPTPPEGYEEERQAVEPPPNLRGVAYTLAVPAYDWYFGCSATSGSMIAAYYDRVGLSNIYTGPTNGGVMPMNNKVWPRWSDGAGGNYGQNPLTASRKGLDGRTTRGSVNDYWVKVYSQAQDPYITGGWSQHAWSDAIGDYMKTSQSAYGNIDGSTTFYSWNTSPDPLTCADMVTHSITKDGTYGRKLFYEARGYTVTDCYNQKTDNNGGGFTFAKYKAEIDAGRPVMINLNRHTVVGIGYSDPNKVYINDTWDNSTHSMTWGGSYSGLVMLSVSIVNLDFSINTWPVNLKPVDGYTLKAGVDKLKLSWQLPVSQKAKNINTYEVQLAADSGYTNIVATKSLKGTSWTYSGLLPNTQYYWRVRAMMNNGVVGSWSSEDKPTSFTTPMTKPPALKAPGNKSKQLKSAIKLTWKKPTGCPKNTTYILQYSTDPTFAAGVTEVTGLLSASYNLTTLPVSGVPGSALYYWRVKAMDAAGTKDYSDWSKARSFKR